MSLQGTMSLSGTEQPLLPAAAAPAPPVPLWRRVMGILCVLGTPIANTGSTVCRFLRTASTNKKLASVHTITAASNTRAKIRCSPQVEPLDAVETPAE